MPDDGDDDRSGLNLEVDDRDGLPLHKFDQMVARAVDPATPYVDTQIVPD